MSIPSIDLNAGQQFLFPIMGSNCTETYLHMGAVYYLILDPKLTKKEF